jgi:hypothetical protein
MASRDAMRLQRILQETSKNCFAHRKEKEKMAEIVMLLSMLLFIGFCTAILALGIYEVYGRKGGEKTISAATTESNRMD